MVSSSKSLDPEDMVKVTSPPKSASSVHAGHLLHFPFRDNAIARRARSPGAAELQYQFATGSRPRPAVPARADTLPATALPSIAGDGIAAVDEEDAQEVVNDRVAKEQEHGQIEEKEEIAKVTSHGQSLAHPVPPEVMVEDAEAGDATLQEHNVGAALREGEPGEEEVIDDRLEENPAEKKRLRREKLSERVMDVFGLEEREEVLEEMKCWLLRSVSESNLPRLA